MKLDPSENVRGGHNWLGGTHWVRVTFVRIPFYLLLGLVLLILPSWFEAGDRYRALPLGWEAEDVLDWAFIVHFLTLYQAFARLFTWGYACIANRRLTPWLDRIFEIKPSDRFIIVVGYLILWIGPIQDRNVCYIDGTSASPTPGATITAIGALILTAMALRVVVYDGWVAWNEAGKAG